MPLKSASPRRNKYAPRADKLIGAWNIASGQLANLATAYGKLGDLTAGANTTFGSDSNGAYLECSGETTDAPLSVQTTGADLVVPEFTIMVEFSNVGNDTQNRPIYSSNSTTGLSSAHGAVLAQWIQSADTLRVSIRDHLNSLTRQYDFTSRSRSAKHVLLIWGGPSGFRATLDGTDPDTTTNSPTTYTGPMRSFVSQYIRFGENVGTPGTFFLGRFHNIAIWRCNLTSDERAEVQYDANICCRAPAGLTTETGAATPRANSTIYAVGNIVTFTGSDYLYECTTGGTSRTAGAGGQPTAAAYDTQTVTDGNVVWTARVASLFLGWAGPTWIGRPKTTSIAFRNVTSPWLQSASVYWRVKVATTKAGVDAATPTTSSQITTASTASTLTQTGLTEGTKYYWQAEWSIDNSTWYPFPCGIGEFYTRSTTVDPVVHTISDGHVNVGTGGVCPSDIGWGDDIALDPGALTVREETGYRNRYACFKTAYDMTRQTAPHFLVWAGDEFMFDSDATTGTTDNTSDMWQRARSTVTFFVRLLKRQANFLTLGNHEGECGIRQYSPGGIAMQKRAFNTRIAVVANPNSTTYAEGGEAHDSSADWVNAGNDPEYIGSTSVDLENYFAFTWGSTLFFFLDCRRYCGVDESSSAYFTAPGSAHLGTTQFNWLLVVLSTSSAALKVGFGHNLIGGIGAGQTSGAQFYLRGSGIDIGQSEPYATLTVDEAPDEITIHGLFRRWGVTAFIKGHDHKFCNARVGGIYYVTLPTSGAPSQSQATTPGWHFQQIVDSYGTAESLGSVDFSGDSLAPKGMIKHYNAMGWTRFTISAGDLSMVFRVTHYYTIGPNNVTDDLKKFYVMWDATSGNGYAERWISDVVHTPASNAVTLATGDSLNAAPEPATLYAAYLNSAITGTWYTSAVTERLAQRAAAAWQAGHAYSVGDYVVPLAHKTGYLYRCTTAGTSHATDEPTFDGGSTSRDWPTTIGGTVTDNGTLVWTCVQVYDQDRPYDTRLPAGATVAVTTASDVQVAYAPRDVYEYDFDTNPPMSGGSSRPRKMSRYQ